MVKKESAKRGYMTNEEVGNHLKGIGTANAKITYLNDIAKRKGLLAEKTREGVYENLGELYSKKGDFRQSARSYEMAGELEKAKAQYVKAWDGETPEELDKIIEITKKTGSKKLAATLQELKNELGEADGNYRQRLQDRGFSQEMRIKEAAKVGEYPNPYDNDHSDIEKFPEWHRKVFGTIGQEIAEQGDPEFGKYIIDHLGNGAPDKSRLAPLRDYISKNLEGLLNGESVFSVIAIAGLGAGIFFLSNNITGNAIADLSTNTTSWVGGVLLAVGLVAGFFWVKSKKKNPVVKRKK
jgi:hypothetical protein